MMSGGTGPELPLTASASLPAHFSAGDHRRMRTPARIGPCMHIKDLKTGAGKSGSHAISGPEVGGGHRMGEGFAIRSLKEPH